MSVKIWSSGNHESEEETPVPPMTKCTAIKSFAGEQPGDLSFQSGEILTIIEPCDVVYWYLAENAQGKRGIIPITYVKLESSGKVSPKKPPPPLPPSNNAPPGLPAKPVSSSPIPALPPKPESSPVKSATIASKTHLTFPRLAQTPPPVRTKKVMRVHSNEFRGAQSSYRNPLSHTLSASPDSRYNMSHRLSHPAAQSPPMLPSFKSSHASPSPPHNSLASEIPPPLPSPRNRAKAVPPPIVPKTFATGSISPQQSSQTLPRSHSPRAPPSIAMDTKSVSRSRTSGLSNSNPILDIDNRPPAPLPNEMSRALKPQVQPVMKYQDQKEFSQRSGWFSPNLETVLCKMMYSSQLSALTSVTTGIYIFIHKQQRTKRYVGKSRTVYHDLVQMFHRLFEKKEEKLNALEMEIKHHSPDADMWSFRVYSTTGSDSIEADANRNILMNNTLQPSGLNSEVRFSTKESFYKFAESYARIQRDIATRTVNPIRDARRSSSDT